MPKRIKTWDELRGVAISLMIFVHFFYYKAIIYYNLNPTQIFKNIAGPLEFFKGFINLHSSYLAPYLFLFIVGIICHIKFKKQPGPDLRTAIKRFLKLYFSTIALSLIFSFHSNNLINIDYFMLLHNSIKSSNILMVIAYVYLVNEFILHSIFKYYNQKLSSKIIFVSISGLLIIIFNITTKDIYPTYHSLPLYLAVFSGCFTALLGDLFLSINKIMESQKAKVVLLYYILIPATICLISLIITKPSMGSIKEMNIIYFMYCFSLSVIFIKLLNFDCRNKFIKKIKEILSLLGRHSLGLYIFHFFIGYISEKYILQKFVPPNYWPINIVIVFVSCIFMAIFLDKISTYYPKKLHQKFSPSA